MVEKVKGVVFRLLEDATGRGDQVALVAFRGGIPEATVALPFTSSLAAATRRLKRIPLSGQTPLADALRRARILLRQELAKHPNAVPLVVVVTDGEATVPLRAGSDPTRTPWPRDCPSDVPGSAVSSPTRPERTRLRGCLARRAAGLRIPVSDLVPDAIVTGTRSRTMTSPRAADRVGGAQHHAGRSARRVRRLLRRHRRARTPRALSDVGYRRVARARAEHVELADVLPERDEPTLVLMALTEELVARLLDDAALRARIAVYDLTRLEKVNAVRSSVFVYFEWFLRDVYGVKLVASTLFTRGLVDRGIISLGFG